MDYYRRTQAAAFKTLEWDEGLFRAIKSVSPKTLIIGRIYRKHQDLDDKSFINECVGNMLACPSCDYVEGFNEGFYDLEGKLPKFTEFEIARMQALERYGKKAAIACFSTGTPEMYCWPYFRPALQWAYDHGHALALHEYSGPYMQWMAGENQWDYNRNAAARVDDPCSSPTVEGWLTLRYRKAYKLFRAWGLGNLPLFITEGGVDDVTPRPGGQGKGYKDYIGTEWDRMPGIGDYAEQRRWYMWQVSHDRYVKGVVDFGWDTADPTWRTFDLSTDSVTLERIISLESTLPVGYLGGTPVDPLSEALLAEAAKKQLVQLNPQSGFQKAMYGAGYWPTSGEFDVSSGGQVYRAQRGEHPVTGAVRVYYALVGHWDRVMYVDRPK